MLVFDLNVYISINKIEKKKEKYMAKQNKLFFNVTMTSQINRLCQSITIYPYAHETNYIALSVLILEYIAVTVFLEQK